MFFCDAQIDSVSFVKEKISYLDIDSIRIYHSGSSCLIVNTTHIPQVYNPDPGILIGPDYFEKSQKLNFSTEEKQGAIISNAILVPNKSKKSKSKK